MRLPPEHGSSVPAALDDVVSLIRTKGAATRACAIIKNGRTILDQLILFARTIFDL